MVWDWICGAFVVGEEDQGSVHELFIREQRSEERLCPIGGILETCVMSVVQHIWGDVCVLWESV